MKKRHTLLKKDEESRMLILVKKLRKMTGLAKKLMERLRFCLGVWIGAEGRVLGIGNI